MNEIIERVAAAICLTGSGNICFAELGPESREWHRAVARAAIEAYGAALAEAGFVIVPREPTEAMIGARSVPGVLEGSDIRLVWMAMIDKALKS